MLPSLAGRDVDFQSSIHRHDAPLRLSRIDRTLPGFVKGFEIVVWNLALVSLAHPAVEEYLQILDGRHRGS